MTKLRRKSKAKRNNFHKRLQAKKSKRETERRYARKISRHNDWIDRQNEKKKLLKEVQEEMVKRISEGAIK